MNKVILLELNELNFEYVERYIQKGYLPNFRAFLAAHGYQQTTSEDVYEHIEPWIQWVSAHTGKPYREHRIFRLGDITSAHLSQIWEELEEKGMRVGTISPMNAENRLKNPAFFIPDPWTATTCAGPRLVREVSTALSQAVNDNAQSRITLKSFFYLLTAFLRYHNPRRLPQFVALLRQSIRKKWPRAAFLDLFLFDLFESLWQGTQPDFASLFLNGAAHIQHHYLFNSIVYEGDLRNPEWYLPKNEDPVLEIYRLYDFILGKILEWKSPIRILIATGLHQVPHDRTTFYYRLKNHADFLRRIGINFRSVQPRMSRDFLITFSSSSESIAAEKRFSALRDSAGVPIFEIDNRGESQFVTLSYPNLIAKDFTLSADGREVSNFENHIAFVALKNAAHDGTGYFTDSGSNALNPADTFPIWELKSRILKVFMRF